MVGGEGRGAEAVGLPLPPPPGTSAGCCRGRLCLWRSALAQQARRYLNPAADMLPDEAEAHAPHHRGDTLSSPSCQGMTWVPKGYAEVHTLGLRMWSYLEMGSRRCNRVKSMSHRVKGTAEPVTGVLRRGVETEGRGKAPRDRGGRGPVSRGTLGATGSWKRQDGASPGAAGGHGTAAPAFGSDFRARTGRHLSAASGHRFVGLGHSRPRRPAQQPGGGELPQPGQLTRERAEAAGAERGPGAVGAEAAGAAPA